jgi:DNA damage-binding protein 1
LGQFYCDSDEEITSVVSFSITIEGQKKPLFCLGTVFYKAEEKEPTAGRLLIFTAYTLTTQSKSSSLELSMLTFANVKGCVYSLKVVENKIVAAVNSSVSETMQLI